MNTHKYIGRFEEINDRSEQDQLALLERARYVAFTELKLGGRAALYVALTILVSFAMAVVAAYVTGLVFLPVWLGLSGFISFSLSQKMTKGLLHKGLSQVLKTQEV